MPQGAEDRRRGKPGGAVPPAGCILPAPECLAPHARGSRLPACVGLRVMLVQKGATRSHPDTGGEEGGETPPARMIVLRPGPPKHAETEKGAQAVDSPPPRVPAEHALKKTGTIYMNLRWLQGIPIATPSLARGGPRARRTGGVVTGRGSTPPAGRMLSAPKISRHAHEELRPWK